MNDAKTMKSNHMGRRLISLLLAVMLVVGLCASAISVNAGTTGAVATGDDQYVYKLVDTVTPGNDYLFVSANKAGSAYALKNSGGTSDGASMGRAQVSVKSADVDNDSTADLYIVAPGSDTVWVSAANGEGFDLTNNGDYLEGKGGEVKIFSSQQYPDRYFTYVGQQLQHVGGRNTYTVYYSNGFTTTYNDSTDKIYAYEKTAVDEIPAEAETTAPTAAPITGNYVYMLTDTMKDGGEYLIVNKKAEGSAYALESEGGSSSGTSLSKSEVSVMSTDLNSDGTADVYVSAADESLVWTAATSGEGFTIKNGADFLEGKSGNIRIYDEQQYPDRYWTYDDSQLRFVGSSTTYTLYYSNSSFTQSTSSSSSSSRELYIYEKTAVDEIPTVIPTEAPTAAPITGDFVFKYVTTVTPGADYLIVNANTAGSAYALSNDGGSSDGTDMSRSSVTVSSGDVDKDGKDDLYIASATSNIVWTSAANGEGFNLTNGSDILEGKSGKVKIYSSVQYPDRYWTYNDQQLQHVGGQNTYTVYYSNSSFTSSYNSSDEKIYVFEKTATDGSTIPATQPATQPQTQPATQPATQKPTAAPSTGDVVNVGITSHVHDSTSELRSWITAVQAQYDPDLDAMAYCGDYSYQFNRSGHVAAFREIVSITNELVGEGKGCYTLGNHEYMNASGIIDDIIDTPGMKLFGEIRKTNDYIIFAMGARTSSDAYSDEDIEALNDYLAAAPKHIPVFIITHYPLHTNSSRTTKNADKVIDVLNQYPNAVFLWGHNHSQSDSHYGEIKVAGDSIEYSRGNNKTINFTYLSAGGMHKESQVKNNSGLVASITGTDVKKVTFQYHRSSNGDKVGSALTVPMDGTPIERPTQAPPTQGPTAAPVTGDFVFKLTDTMKAGGEYLIVNTNKAGNAYSLKNEGGSSSGTSLARNSVNIQKSDLNSDGVEDTYIVSGTTDTVWLASANVDGYRLTNNGDYLEGKSNKISIYNSVQNSDRYWTYSNNQLKFAGGSSTYSFYYSSNNFTGSTSSNSGKLYIYEKTGVDTMPTEVKPTEAPPIVAGEGTNLGFTSDVHGSMDRLENWLDAVQNAYDPNLDAMTYCGDYSYVTNSTSSYLADFKEVVSITDSKVGSGKGIYTSGNHEYYTNGEQSKLDSGFTNTPGFTRIGEAKVADNYRIYCMGAAGWFSANGEYPQADIDALDAYLDSAPTDVPIFIAAHFPLHYFAGSSSGWGGSSGRTITNADKMIDVLNKHPNAVFFWGHNHSQSDPEYGTIKTAGDSITYASGKSKDINFTYASVGAIYDDDQTMYSGVVATVSDSGDKVIFRYWNAGNGKQLGNTYSIDIEGGAGVTTYTISASAGANGKVSPSGDVKVREGGSKEFTFTPNAGYDVDTVTVDGKAVTLTNGKYTFTNVTANHTIRATFKQAQGTSYTLTSGAEAGGKYLVVSNGYALRNNNGKIDAVPVVVSDDNKTVFISDSSNNESVYWTLNASTTSDKAGDFTVENDGYKLSRVTNSESASNALEITKENKTSQYSGLPYYQFSYDAAARELSMKGGQEGNDIFYAFYNTSANAFYTDTNSDKLGLYEVAEAPYLRGDADADGEVTIMDATAVQHYVAEVLSETVRSTKNADADLNSKIDIIDALVIQRIVNKIYASWADVDAIG